MKNTLVLVVVSIGKKLNVLSKGIFDVIDIIFTNDKLCKLLRYDNIPNSLDKSDIVNSSLIFKKVFPFPFDPSSQTDDSTSLRIYFINGAFRNNALEKNNLIIDIIIAKSIGAWLLANDEIRPYVIMQELIDSLHNKKIGSGFKMNFLGYNFIYVNERFDAFRLTWDIMDLNSGKM